MADDEYMAELLVKHLTQEATPAEEQLVKDWLDADEKHVALYDQFRDPEWFIREIKEYDDDYNYVDIEAGLVKIHEKIERAHDRAVNVRRSVKIGVGVLGAVAVILLVIFLVPFWNNHSTPGEQQTVDQIDTFKNDTLNKQAPIAAKGQALLELQGGKLISLDTAKNGVIGREGDWQIIKEDGLVRYQSMGIAQQEKPFYSRLITGPECLYQLILGDKSKIWLHAKSSVLFASYTKEKERKVEMTGEAYFEVKHDPTKPFRVIVDKTEFQVLGTRFNIDASNEDSTVTTALVEGAIKISAGEFEKILEPGQIAYVIPGQPISVKRDSSSVNKMLSWTKKEFNFNKANITTIMRELQRWYDIEVVYKDTPDVPISSSPIPYSLGIDATLEVLNESKLVRIKKDKKLVTISSW